MARDKHNHSHHHHTEGNIVVAFWLNLSFSIIELFGGLLTNSIAILSDSLHDLGDSFSLGLAWYFQKLSKKKRDAKYSYGYRRFSLLGAIINSVVLLIGSFFVISESVRRIFSPEQPDAKGMLFLAILGIVINGAAVLRLRKGNSLNERAISLHLLEDVLGWIAVLIGSIVMMFADVPILDPLLSLAIAVFILANIYRNLRDTFRVVLQGTPEDIEIEEIEKALESIPQVISLHDLHAWTMDGEYNIMTIHVVYDAAGELDCAQLKQRIRETARNYNIQHLTIEMGLEDEKCELENCNCDN